MKNLSLLFLVFFRLSLGFGQTPVLDSLKQEFAKAKSDTTKVLLYEKLMKASQSQTAIDYGMKGLALAKRIHSLFSQEKGREIEKLAFEERERAEKTKG